MIVLVAAFPLRQEVVMELTEGQFKAIEPHLPTQRGNVKIDNRSVINALLHLMYEGCTWRRLLSQFGAWHTIYTRWLCWSRKGVCRKVFRALQETGVLPSDATYFAFVQLAFIAIALRRLSVNTP